MSADLKGALAAIAGFLLGLFAASFWRPMPPDVRIWEARVAAYQQDSLAFERTIAMLNGTVAQLDDSARVLETARAVAVATADAAARERALARRRTDAALSLLDSARTAADSVPVLVAALDARTEEAEAATTEAGSIRVALAAQIAATGRLRAALDTSKAAGDSLAARLRIADDLLRDRPQTDRCRVLWFNCPSRTTTFVIGAIGGAVATGLVLR